MSSALKDDATENSADVSTPDLSIIVLSYNTKAMLRDCLTSVMQNPPTCSWETVCVDDFSSDGSAEMVAEEFPTVKVTRNHANLGYSAANNVALKQCRGRYILLLNSDVLIHSPETFDSMIEFLDEHPEAGVAGQKLLNTDGSVQLSCRRFPSIGFSVRQSFLPASLRRSASSVRDYYMADFNYDEVAEVEMAAATCSMVRASVVEQVGLMDERFFLYVGDADWFKRIHDAGWKTFFLPQHPVTHLGGLSANPRRLYLLWDFHRGLYHYYRKHLAASTPFWQRPLVLPGICCRFVMKFTRWALRLDNRVCSDDFK